MINKILPFSVNSYLLFTFSFILAKEAMKVKKI